jgi:hypothetical protein
MPAELPRDTALLKAVADELSRSGAAALATSRELLAHYADTGDDPTQRAVDTLVDHAVGALLAMNDSMLERCRELEHRV